MKAKKKELPDSETLRKAIFVLESDSPNSVTLRLAIDAHYEAILARRDKDKRMVEIRSQLKLRQDELEAMINKQNK